MDFCVLPGLHILLGGLESRENCNTDHRTGFPLVGLELPPSFSSPCCMSPVAPWWDTGPLLVIFVSSFILDFLLWSVPVCCHTEQNRVIVSAATRLVLYRCVSALYTQRVSSIPLFSCPAKQPAFPARLFQFNFVPFLPWALCIFLHPFFLCLQFCTPGFPQRPVYPFSLSEPGAPGFPSFCAGAQLISSLAVPSILQRGEDLSSSQILTCLIPSSSFPFILFCHGDKSEALQKVSVMIPRWETGKGKEILTLVVLWFSHLETITEALGCGLS